MKVFEIEKILDEKLKKINAMDWDNVGLLIGRKRQDVKRILLALELTETIIREAAEKGANFIIVHHPVIFSGLKRVIDTENPLIYSLIANEIAVYVAHTNFDVIHSGLNDYLARKLGAISITVVQDKDDCGLLRIFEIPSTPVKEFAFLIKERLKLKNIRAVGDFGGSVSRVGLVTGAGFEYAELAAQHGAELFISGDLKYHQAMVLKERNISALDVGHFETEYLFSSAIEEFIQKNIPELVGIERVISQKEKPPIEYI